MNIPADYLRNFILLPIATAALPLCLVLLSSTAAVASDRTLASECVVMVHGLGRTSHSMDDMEDAFRAAGYRTVNIDYPSRSEPIQELAERVGREAMTGCREQQADVIHFVTHSMGGILVRYYLSKNDIPGLGRVVMLAPPNQGSILADRLRNDAWYRWLLGPAGQQLGTGRDGIPGMLGAVDYPTGVIAGDEHSPVDNWLAEMIPGEDDGKVSVEHAKVEGMQDFLVLPCNHITIMQQPEVIGQGLFFIRHGRFDHAAAQRLQQTGSAAGQGWGGFD